MISSKLDWLVQCCRRGSHDGKNELLVNLQSDSVENSRHLHLITRTDSFDITFTPRRVQAANTAANSKQQVAITPRQADLKTRLELPSLHQYPVPPGVSPEEPEDAQRNKLLELYQEFALDLHTGMYLTQLTSTRDYSDIHCQLMEDLQTLKLDQSNGRIIEFPLTGVSKVYRIVKNDDKWYSAGSLTGASPVPPLPLSNAEHIVVVEFMRRKLAFVFKEIQASQRFLMCMELLIRRAQQKQAGRTLRSLTPTFPPSGEGPDKTCATPRQVKEAEGHCIRSPGSGMNGAQTPRPFLSPQGMCDGGTAVK